MTINFENPQNLQKSLITGSEVKTGKIIDVFDKPIIMKTICIIIYLSFIIQVQSFAQNNRSEKYLGETPPDTQPKEFGTNHISNDSTYVFGTVFSAEADELYYAVRLDEDWNAELWHTEYKNGKWTEPMRVALDDKYSYNDPFLSFDENQLYYMSDYNKGSDKPADKSDLWYSEKIGESWSEPINLGAPINTDKNEFYISLTKNKTLYFSSNRGSSGENQSNYDLYYSVYKNGRYQEPIRMGKEINSDYFDVDPFIAPDESYMIFSSTRPVGSGKGDLYISFKTKEGNWTKAMNMGDPINTEEREFCPFVSRDGKYLFFTRNGKIFWVSTKVIDSLRNDVLK